MPRPPPNSEAIVVGVDGCPARWMAVWGPLSGADGINAATFPDFGAILAQVPSHAAIAIDMPIGLLDAAERGGRMCEVEARRLLRPCGSRVFAAPVFKALSFDSHALASDENARSSAFGLGISVQCFGLFPRLRDIHAIITPAQQRTIIETHPELSFACMNVGQAVVAPKRTKEGRAKRLALLAGEGFTDVETWFGRIRRRDAEYDDIMDAFACFWTARRHARGETVSLPSSPPRDSRGLEMAIRY